MKVHPIYTPTIMDGAVIRFETGYVRGTYRDIVSGKERTDFSAEVNASRNGVSLNGDWPILSTREDVDMVIDLLNRAWDAHEAIAHARGSDQHDVAKLLVENAAIELADRAVSAP